MSILRTDSQSQGVIDEDTVMAMPMPTIELKTALRTSKNSIHPRTPMMKTLQDLPGIRLASQQSPCKRAMNSTETTNFGENSAMSRYSAIMKSQNPIDPPTIPIIEDNNEVRRLLASQDFAENYRASSILSQGDQKRKVRNQKKQVFISENLDQIQPLRGSQASPLYYQRQEQLRREAEEMSSLNFDFDEEMKLCTSKRESLSNYRRPATKAFSKDFGAKERYVERRQLNRLRNVLNFDDTVSKEEVIPEGNPILAEIYHRLREPATSLSMLKKSLHSRPTTNY